MITDPTLFRPLLLSSAYRAVEDHLRAGGAPVAVSGLVRGARALALVLLGARLRRRLVVVVPDDAAMTALAGDLAATAALAGRDPRRIVEFPALDADPYDAIPPHPEVVRERVVAIGRIVAGEADVVLTPARALTGRLPSPATWAGWTRRIALEDELSPERFVLEAIGLGYRRVETVSAPGEVSRRGGIVDVFPPQAEEPVRIELFGDTVDSLRAFDPDHQRSTGTLREVVVGPAAENPPTDEAVARLARYLETGMAGAGDPGLARQYRRRLETLRSEGYLPGIEALGGLTLPHPVTLVDLVPGSFLAIDEPERVGDELLRADRDSRASWDGSGDRVLPPPADLFADVRALRERLRGAELELRELVGEEPRGPSEPVHVASRPAPSFSGRMRDLVAEIGRQAAAGGRIVCLPRTAGGAERLVEILREYDVAAAAGPAPDEHAAGETVRVVPAGLRAGFELPDAGLLVLTEREIFGEERRAPERKARGHAAFVSDFRDLKSGDLVVHVDHGVARYAGLGRPKGGSANRDFMVLEFSGGDRLFVPVDRLDLVQKYSGVAGARPALDRLGGPGWDRVKARVRKSVESMARDLLELYARRKAVRGHAAGPDTPWQRELEDAFAFELTPDQERAVRDVKEDMESSRVMDRLLVGDVGFGKTEVAVRAAFKAVMDGRQVAVLAPTTVLVFQHEETFRRRFAPFPVKVESVSRFRSTAEIRDVLERTVAGDVDVLIGTHRLLSRDVRFRKLGLLVVDEEQRFGVAHKERLKTLAIGVDVLSMTATPIPRTLQMSLAGVRDLSLIETPPPGRMAIQTYLVPWRTNVVAQALRQELRRGGQVFVVHNRIETLHAVVRAVREVVPDARVVMAHGRMREHQLERVMLQFVRHEADILVTTTIIENGLDIPRANTIVVNRADRFGLAQLYQLRGRVGRSERHAYAYFIVPGRHSLAETARRRLKALQEFSELGAGFRLAAADLEIRGAGELLGARQSGHIEALGFDLYCQMLERAVHELQGEPIEEPAPVSLHLGIDFKVPETYMPDAGDRLALYKRLAGARDDADIDRILADAEDRFGRLPPPGVNLFALTRLRLLAQQARIRSVDVADGRVQIRFDDGATPDTDAVLDMLARERATLTPSGMLSLPAPNRPADRIRSVRRAVERILGRSAA